MPDRTQSRANDRPRPGNLYGATKAWAEALGGVAAADLGRRPTDWVFAEAHPGAAVSGRERSAWLSPRDAAEPVRAAVEANCVTFTPANRISANRYLAADLEEMMQQLGYGAVDDARASR